MFILILYWKCNEMPHTKFNVLWTMHHDIFVQQEPTGCTVLLSIYFDTLSRFTAHHQEVIVCIYSSWYVLC